MTKDDLVRELRNMAVETGSLSCLGCGHEHNCGVSGCAILREAEQEIAYLTEAAERMGKMLCDCAPWDFEPCPLTDCVHYTGQMPHDCGCLQVNEAGKIIGESVFMLRERSESNAD